jgi:chromosome segregation ATPase
MQGLSSNIKNIIYVTVGLVLLYGVIWLATRELKMPTEIKASIDSLTAANKKLIESQQHMNNAINSYELKLNTLDSQIDNIKNKTIIINKYYNDLGQQVDQYVPNQIDSFFKQRYNY